MLMSGEILEVPIFLFIGALLRAMSTRNWRWVSIRQVILDQLVEQLSMGRDVFVQGFQVSGFQVTQITSSITSDEIRELFALISSVS